ncbi:uncharacterized protein J4E78_004049 [Alternaria triticimaculans]|uniref:uncharacterized protein n=1 Tax=Alternaria triticimaculans TaxID=297637 RepID=UPI0020C4ECBD|nr:uncharacterized protein J4E78_004049 [Alternaria triticimaculans]KAI4663633.1 hypothetical protein J4E78_004049 [Alternaria triticimaculans]
MAPSKFLRSGLSPASSHFNLIPLGILYIGSLRYHGMSTTSLATGDVVATLPDGNSFQSAQHATIPHPIGCECSHSHNVLDTSAPAQLASDKDATGTHIATNNEPGDSRKRQNEVHQEEQEAANK